MRVLIRALALVVAVNGSLASLAAQAPPPVKVEEGKKADAKKSDSKKGDTKKSDSTAAKKETMKSPLFKGNDVLTATLTANFKSVRRDKNETAPWHAATI